MHAFLHTPQGEGFAKQNRGTAATIKGWGWCKFNVLMSALHNTWA